MRWFRRNTAEPVNITQGRTRPDQPIEVGTIEWGRSLDAALAESQRSAKPVFALFQEVPGCAGCKQFGADVLSHPLIVDAVHEAFVPLLIHNNSPGADADVLAHYGEPAWNFQVVRFLDGDGVDVIERRDRVWETGPLAARMLHALRAASVHTPLFLELLEQESSPRLQTLEIAQECFWVGETMIGRLDGVVTTQAGFCEGLEVTRVEFDPGRTSIGAVLDAASASGVASAAFVEDPTAASLRYSQVPLRPRCEFTLAPVSDQKRQLSAHGQALSSQLDLSLAQLTKLNGFAPTGTDRGLSFVSARQRAALHES